jgi:hypothetical protein
VQRNREAVDLQFRDVLDRAAVGEFAATLVEGAQVFDVVAVVEREHRPPVDVFRKTFGGPAADALRRAVGCDEFGVLGFELLESC